jgi:hypothetical protein
MNQEGLSPMNLLAALYDFLESKLQTPHFDSVYVSSKLKKQWEIMREIYTSITGQRPDRTGEVYFGIFCGWYLIEDTTAEDDAFVLTNCLDNAM